MAKHLQLRAWKPAERATLRAKIRDLSLAARIHQRYRIIDLVRRGFGLVDVSERVGVISRWPMTGSAACCAGKG